MLILCCSICPSLLGFHYIKIKNYVKYNIEKLHFLKFSKFSNVLRLFKFNLLLIRLKIAMISDLRCLELSSFNLFTYFSHSIRGYLLL